MEYIYIIILLIVGIIMIVNPELLWKIEHIFTVKNGEPTELYMAFTRIVGVLLVCVTIVITVALFFQ